MFNKGGARGQHSLYPNTPSNIDNMEAKKTVWSIFRDYVNSKPIGTEITRQQILSVVNLGMLKNTASDMTEEYKLARFSATTVDCNRNMSEKVGYLAKTNKSGIYRVVKHFAADYTVSQLRKDYDNGSRNNSNKD